MRIGIFIDGTFIPERDGASTRFAHLPTKLAKAGVEVVVFHCFRGWSQLERICNQPYTTYFFPPEVFYTDLNLLRHLVREQRIDIIQVNDAETMQVIGFPLSSILNIRTVYEAHYHTSTLARSLGLPQDRIQSLELLEHEVGMHADEIITFTEQDRQRWITFSGCDRQRVSVVPFGVPSVKFTTGKRKAQMLFLGNMYYEPNRRAVECIIKDILPIVRSLCSEVHTVIAGDIPENLRELCQSAGMEVIGETPDLTPWLCESLVGLAPVSEGGGVRVKILQYLSNGLPVVATPVAAEGLIFPALFQEDNLTKYALR
ncbi:MAG TPA: glycosyltransferase family 4 protein, partial [Pyrinomonadaceae bacterium]|nr:glycosyltransferase family 4 protein [Pyrinomonadaceae bacterium]